MPQRIMDLSGQTVSLLCLTHPLRDFGIFLQLVIGIFQIFIGLADLLIQHADLVDRSPLLLYHQDTINNKQYNIQGIEQIITAHQITLH